MKLIDILKGCAVNKSVQIINHDSVLEWDNTDNGNVDNRHYIEWLDNNVIATTINNRGKTIIILE